MRGKANRLLRWTLYAAIFSSLSSSMAAPASQSGPDPRRPDSYNSSVPEKPPSPNATAPAKTAPADRLLAQKTQNAIKADENLSDGAHKIQVRARDGKVTLLGVVASQAERDAVVSKVKELAGVGNVVNRLKITTASQ